MLKRLIVGGAAVLAVGGTIWGISGEDHTKRDSTGTVVTAGQLGVFVTHLGDCFQTLPAGVVSTVNAVPCTSPHHWQEIYKGTIADSTFNGQVISQEAQRICDEKSTLMAQSLTQTLADEYKDASENSFTPTPESWAKGDRGIDCMIGNHAIFYSDSLLQ